MGKPPFRLSTTRARLEEAYEQFWPLVEQHLSDVQISLSSKSALHRDVFAIEAKFPHGLQDLAYEIYGKTLRVLGISAACSGVPNALTEAEAEALTEELKDISAYAAVMVATAKLFRACRRVDEKVPNR